MIKQLNGKRWCWNVVEILLNKSFANDQWNRTPILELGRPKGVDETHPYLCQYLIFGILSVYNFGQRFIPCFPRKIVHFSFDDPEKLKYLSKAFASLVKYFFKSQSSPISSKNPKDFNIITECAFVFWAKVDYCIQK